jgi:hypothetical protein
MDGFRFDHLTRLVGSRLSRRSSLALLVAAGLTPSAPATAKKSKKIKICYKDKTRKVKKQDWKKRYKGATKGACQVTADVCAGCPNTCFATVARPDQVPSEFACCPPEKTCISRTSLPDQCCYPDETCDPTLAEKFPLQAQTNCCRPCSGAVATDGCCVSSSEECDPITNTCVPANTARLPRTRRG